MTPIEKVANGVALLDADYPNWEWMINLPALDLTSAYQCVLGQIYGLYWKGVINLNAHSEDGYAWAVNHGFVEGFDGGEEYVIRNAWIAVVQQRREAVAGA